MGGIFSAKYVDSHPREQDTGDTPSVNNTMPPVYNKCCLRFMDLNDKFISKMSDIINVVRPSFICIYCERILSVCRFCEKIEWTYCKGVNIDPIRLIHDTWSHLHGRHDGRRYFYYGNIAGIRFAHCEYVDSCEYCTPSDRFIKSNPQILFVKTDGGDYLWEMKSLIGMGEIEPDEMIHQKMMGENICCHCDENYETFPSREEVSHHIDSCTRAAKDIILGKHSDTIEFLSDGATIKKGMCYRMRQGRKIKDIRPLI